MKRAGTKSVLLLLILLLCFAGCAPKKVSVYEKASDLRGVVVQAVVDQLGRPYKNGSKGPDSFDCSGLVYYAYKRVNITLPVMTEGQIIVGREIVRDQVLPGDLVFFKIKKSMHVGIMINKKEFIHASKSRGVAVDDVDAAYWKKGFLFYRCIL